jgi:hypothetical protein
MLVIDRLHLCAGLLFACWPAHCSKHTVASTGPSLGEHRDERTQTD